jgi:hypothetical protein
MATREFIHDKHNKKDMENCAACILLHSGEEGPNYAAWPLSFLVNGKDIPRKYFKALENELKSDNLAYVKNLENHLKNTKYESFIKKGE